MSRAFGRSLEVCASALSNQLHNRCTRPAYLPLLLNRLTAYFIPARPIPGLLVSSHFIIAGHYGRARLKGLACNGEEMMQLAYSWGDKAHVEARSGESMLRIG